ncbi:MAG: hypothetical protein M1840_001120 [Geoglossum simile]|nr:MAG: hypothetical protein M1840_001120 [Geoglossum simile]
MPNQQPKKPRMPKDAAIFVKGKIKGEVRYPPCERYSKEVMEKLEEFKVRPTTGISEFCRSIPYNSEKKGFHDKTGREGFEVFQYVYRVPDDDREYTVMWDYNIGLVRVTPFFKCCKFSKATPSRALGHNPGLREISHSITGGALAAQGYWLPFEAAKAVAAKFCYPIRHALVPIFSEDFPALCAVPGTDEFGVMTIDQAITRRCAELANKLRQHEAPSSRESSAMAPRRQQQRRRRPSKSLNRLESEEVESGYCSDTDASTRSPTFTPQAARLCEKRSLPQPDPATTSQKQQEQQQQQQRRSPTPPWSDEERAARLIMELHKADRSLLSKRRRFSL